MPEEQKATMDSWIEAHPTSNLRAAIEALPRQKSHSDKAKELLRKYNTLARLIPNDDTRSLREDAAKNLGISPEDDHAALNEADLKGVGAIKQDGQEKIERTLELEDSLMTYSITPEGKVKVLVVRVTGMEPKGRQLHVADVEGGGRSTISTGFAEQMGKYRAECANGNCYVTADQIGNGEKFLVCIIPHKQF